ncbi:MAG: hypothetical protein U0U70_11150 [Chitinophagaceae bacterium]
MAILSGNLQFTGSFNDMNAYQMKSSGKWVVRRKGGPTSSQVKTGEQYKITGKITVSSLLLCRPASR